MWGEIQGTGLAGGGTGAAGRHGDTSQGTIMHTCIRTVLSTWVFWDLTDPGLWGFISVGLLSCFVVYYVFFFSVRVVF